jgi:hypothetical protein
MRAAKKSFASKNHSIRSGCRASWKWFNRFEDYLAIYSCEYRRGASRKLFAPKKFFVAQSKVFPDIVWGVLGIVRYLTAT